MDTEWQWRAFPELSPADLYQVMQKRQEVFILEQTCLCPDLDGLDQDAHHLLGWRIIGGKRQLAAYLRCVAPGAKYLEASLGRIMTTSAARGSGIGRTLVAQGIAHAERQHPGQRICIDAQQHLEGFYREFGFVACSEPYDEDGIMHVDMRR